MNNQDEVEVEAVFIPTINQDSEEPKEEIEFAFLGSNDLVPQVETELEIEESENSDET